MTLLNRMVLVVVGVVTCVASGWCGDLADLQARAESGNAEAQFQLGCAYAVERGTMSVEREDRLLAFGCAEAVAKLDVPDDHAEARQWWARAAAQGHADAQFGLGFLLSHGEGGERDDRGAVEWWRKAAEQGHSRAQLRLAYAYEQGIGVDGDLVRAHMWYSVAAAKASGDWKLLVEDLVDQMEWGMERREREEARKLAEAWLSTH